MASDDSGLHVAADAICARARADHLQRPCIIGGEPGPQVQYSYIEGVRSSGSTRRAMRCGSMSGHGGSRPRAPGREHRGAPVNARAPAQ